jgi:hypothetical protein
LNNYKSYWSLKVLITKIDEYFDSYRQYTLRWSNTDPRHTAAVNRRSKHLLSTGHTHFLASFINPVIQDKDIHLVIDVHILYLYMYYSIALFHRRAGTMSTCTIHVCLIWFSAYETPVLLILGVLGLDRCVHLSNTL